jgi:hypothetical protein
LAKVTVAMYTPAAGAAGARLAAPFDSEMATLEMAAPPPVGVRVNITDPVGSVPVTLVRAVESLAELPVSTV